MKRFLGYLIFRIYLRGTKIMGLRYEKDEIGGYFYMLIIVSFLPAMIVLVGFIIPELEERYNINFSNKNMVHKLLLLPFSLLIIYPFSFLLPFKRVKNLNYTLDERKKYRNVFLLLLFLFVSLIIYSISK